MKLSLIIPAYNEEKGIGKCLAAAVKHGAGKFKEIVVVDNASTDNTAAVAASFPGVRVVREDQKGTNFARQRGVEETTSELLAFLDADTLLRAGWIEKVERAFARDPKLVCLTGPYWFYDLPRHHAFAFWLNWHFAHITHFFTSAMGVTGNMVLRRSVLQNMGGFDTSYTFSGDDVDTALRASKFGRVTFTFDIILDSSGRRYKKLGYFHTIGFYIQNAIRVIFDRPQKDSSNIESVR